MKVFYKVVFGYNQSISIEGKDLVRALYAHMTGKSFVSESGMLDGKLIQAIIPNYNKTMGWHETYKITPDDEIELQKIESQFTGKMATAKEYCMYCMEARIVPDMHIILAKARELLADVQEFTAIEK